MNYWLVKSPFRSRSWTDVLVKGTFKLYGIRNHQAKNHIAQMKRGDKTLYYHGPSGRHAFGIMQVARPPYPDPTSNSQNWLAVDFEPAKTFAVPVTLEQIMANPTLQQITLVKQPRLSVMPLTVLEFETIVQMAEKIAAVEGNE